MQLLFPCLIKLKTSASCPTSDRIQISDSKKFSPLSKIIDTKRADNQDEFKESNNKHDCV
jgi:hypothetical protein